MNPSLLRLVTSLVVLLSLIPVPLTVAAQSQSESQLDPPTQAVMRIFERVTLTDPTQTFAIEVIVEEFETESLAISYTDVSIQSYLKPVSLSDQCPGDPKLSDIGQITTPLVGDESIAIRVTMTYPPSPENVQEISVIGSTIMSREGRFLSTVQGYALASDPIDDVANVATQILADDWIHASERSNSTR